MTAEEEEEMKKMREKAAKLNELRPKLLITLAIINWINVILMGIVMILRFYNH